MNFFRNLFRPRKQPSAPEGEPIKAFDKYGREILIPRGEWLQNVLLRNIRKAWNDPAQLSALLISAFNDGFFAELEDAGRQLHQIDSEPARGATLLGIIYLQTGRPREAEQILRDHLARHGADGVVLTNLAKAQDALGRSDESLRTLWHALELDPNQENGFGWYEGLHRRKGGDPAGQAALERLAALPGSWRAQLWLARAALEQRDLGQALSLYRTSLAAAPRPVPTDLLAQMSGDLGNHAHLVELLELTTPHFDLEAHGLLVGNNLLKASLDTGQLDEARALLQRLQACQRPDWREHLSFWEGEIAKVGRDTQDPIPPEQLRVTLIAIPGPLWLVAGTPLADLFPAKAPDAPRLTFLGCSYEGSRIENGILVQPSDNPGRLSRAIPLHLAELIHLTTPAHATTLIPWLRNNDGGFVLSGKPTRDEDIAHCARTSSGGEPSDYAVNCHLLVRGENWTLKVRVLRTIDAHCLAAFSHDFAEGAFHPAATRVLSDLTRALQTGAGIAAHTPPPDTTLSGPDLDHYLFRLEQTLAVRCLDMQAPGSSFLTNPTEIINGLIQLCLQNPALQPSRLLLWCALRSLRNSQPGLVLSFREKVEALQTDHPLAPRAQPVLDEALAVLFRPASA